MEENEKGERDHRTHSLDIPNLLNLSVVVLLLQMLLETAQVTAKERLTFEENRKEDSCSRLEQTRDNVTEMKENLQEREKGDQYST
uniref:Trichohyalin-like n=1 Tax=Heterorhabditis bacteriophora TaxID=37862 RepID=A0A1I7WWG0_HETBA